MWLAGFDPGGVDQFGWCVAEATPVLPLTLHMTGIASSAKEAVDCVLKAVPSQGVLAAVGIDSPLFWSIDGDRNADRVVRDKIKGLGATAPSGTVQHVNSLRGACLAQGLIAARLLQAAVPSICVTEAHPKALLWLLGIATRQKPVKSITMRDLSAFFSAPPRDHAEHERDAALASLGAWAMMQRASDWADLFELESQPFVPVPSVAYWMPNMSSNLAFVPSVTNIPKRRTTLG